MASAQTPRDRVASRTAELDGEIADAEHALHALTLKPDDEAAAEAARLFLRLRALREERRILAEATDA